MVVVWSVVVVVVGDIVYREQASHPSAHHQQPPLQPRRTYKIVQAFLSSVFFHSQVNSLFQVKICWLKVCDELILKPIF